MTFRKLMLVGACLMAAVMAVPPADAAPRKKELRRKESYTQADAVKGMAYVQAAMTQPMEGLLAKADVQNPEIMLEYGLALDLGRPSVSQTLPQGERDKLKRGFREMLDLYLDSGDKFDINFDEDAMLDQAEFWIYLAKHVGRPRPGADTSSNIAIGAMGADASNVGSNAFLLDNINKKEFNLNEDLILKTPVVNAATTCTDSARSFARMKKAQTVAIEETTLTPEKFTDMRATAARLYKTSYVLGVSACAGQDNFMAAANFASDHLGTLGAKKDDPAAIVVDLNTGTPQLEDDAE